MFSHKNIVIFCALIILFCEKTSSKVAPDYIKPCPSLTPECLKKTIQETIPLFSKGIPGLGIDSTDPGHEERVDIELPGGLKIVFTEGVATGVRKCIVDSAKYEKAEAHLDVHCNLTIKGKYKAAGRILIVSINGEGDAKIKIPNIAISSVIKFEDQTRDGVVYHVVKDMKVKTRYDSRVTFVFANLFKGNQQLSETVLAFLNENWKQILEEFGKPVENVLIAIAEKAIRKFFSAVPKNELFVS